MYQPPPPYPGTPPPRKGLSTLAIVLISLGGCAVVCLGGFAILAAIMFPVFAKAREAARKTSCLSNVKQLALGLNMYIQDYDQTLPPASQWEDLLQPYLGNASVNVCPSDTTGTDSYALYSALSDREMRTILAPAATPTLFESSLHARNGNDLFVTWDPRHYDANSNKVGSVAYLDGSARAVANPQAGGSGY